MSRLTNMLRLAATLSLIAGTVVLSSAQDEREGRPRVLVTNDDGIDSRHLHVLVKELSSFADVTVSAPASNRSGSSHSLTYFAQPLDVREVEIEGALRAFAVNGSPADAAHFGIVHLGSDAPFDLLISGMNRGSNVGDLSHGSGTVGAAMEGAFQRVPSMAVSVEARLRDLDAAASFARRFAQQWLERGTDAGVVYSINVPRLRDGKWKGVRAAPMGGSYLSARTYVEAEGSGESRAFRARVAFDPEAPKGSDTKAFLDGFVTITPLRFDWTHREALAGLADWDL